MKRSGTEVVLNDLLELTDEEEKAVRSLKRLARRWPDSLLVFCGGTGMSIRKGGTGAQYEVASIDGIPCDGGGWWR